MPLHPPWLPRALAAAALASSLPLAAPAAPPGPELFSALRWRSIGPYRGGRTKAATGVPGRPGLFFIGPVDGGIFRSDDYGRTWTPIFDDQPTASIGAIAVAPSNPDVIYAGSGEGLPRPDLSTGDGIYKSIDGGRTWAHLGLRDGQQIPQIAVDPRDPDRLFVAVLGHPYGPNPERGLFRSLDGGKTFEKVLYLDPDTGAADVAIDPHDPQTLLASLWEERQAPWEDGEFAGPGSGLYKSTDGGASWRRIDGGLPNAGPGGLTGRFSFAFAPSKQGRVYLTAEGGLYRSDDGGERWQKACDDRRVVERGSEAEVRVHPQDADTVFTIGIVVWKSTDGGRSFTALRGAPGGDDYQRLWIDPARPEVMLLASDQGAIVTVNGGGTWSSWYNQPTAQIFKVTADDAFPYRLCGGQQDSGSACVSSRGPHGAVTFRDWQPAGLEEYGQAAPDPRDPDVVYGGRLTRWDRRTGQRQEVAPEALLPPGYRVLRTAPVFFSPHDPRALFFASNVLWRTRDGGRRWERLSPDLTRAAWEAPATVGKYRERDDAKGVRRGVIYAAAQSPRDPKLLWAGTDDGLIHLTRDGGQSWREVTPPQLSPWAKVSTIEPAHESRQAAWAAINTLRLDDLRPHVLRTRDGGATWDEAVAGLPEGATVNVVREDPARPGLLFAGTERGVHVSFDGGDRWLPLRNNLPATSVRDLIVKGDDLAIATHGRGFWILDDLTPLRQLRPELLDQPAHLFAPQRALRVRWDTYTDTPPPPEEPAGQNPPDGAILHYWLRDTQQSPLQLEIADAAGRVVRRFRSDDPRAEPRDEGQIPRRWIRPDPALEAGPGLHRFVWDLHEAPPAGLERHFPIGAVPGDTPAEPRGPWITPGRYAVRLTAGGRTLSQPLTIALDPRLKTPPSALQRQHALSERLLRAAEQAAAGLTRAAALRASLQPLADAAKSGVACAGSARGPAEKAPAACALLERLAALEGPHERWPRRLRDAREGPNLQRARRDLISLYQQAQEADAAPTPQVERAAQGTLRDAEALARSLAALEADAARLSR